MSAKILKERLSRQPFEPFRVRLSSGDAYEIRHPEMALLYKSGLYVALNGSEDGLADDVVWCSLLHIAAVEATTTDTSP